jgi:hypothetical protein
LAVLALAEPKNTPEEFYTLSISTNNCDTIDPKSYHPLPPSPVIRPNDLGAQIIRKFAKKAATPLYVKFI